MRFSILLAALLAGTCAAHPPLADERLSDAREPGEPSRFLFISPMGEPFRTERPDQVWFTGADTDHDDRITRAEFLADAARFFRLLDRRGDGEIGPDDNNWYETEVAPEIRVADGDGPVRGSGPGGPGRGLGEPGGGGPGGGGPLGGGGPPRGGGDDGRSSHQLTRTRARGAAQYGYLDLPQPVISADANFNRGVDINEFDRAADLRFRLLDRNGDGAITRAELPAVNTRVHGGAPRGRPPGPPRERPAPPPTEDAKTDEQS